METEYAQVARETLQSTSLEGWLIPHFNGDIYSEKPPLYFWLMALASLPVGDITEFTARLPSALSALGTVIILYFLGRTLFNERTGLLASLILLSSPGFFRSACTVRIDMPVAFFFTLSLASFYTSLATSKRQFSLLGWFSAALCSLIKGPIYPLLIALVLSSYLILRKELHRLKETLPALGAFTFLVTIGLWLLPIYLKAEPYLKGLLNWGIWYLKEEEYHAESFYFYIPQFLAGMAPWSLFVLLALYYYCQKDTARWKSKGVSLIFPCLWLLFGLIAFSLLSTKHSRYILFLYPAGALTAALMWEDFWAKSLPLWPWQKWLPVFIISASTGVTIASFVGKYPSSSILGLSIVGVCMLTTVYLIYRASQMRLLFGAILLVLTVSQAIYYQFLLPLQNDSNSERPLCQKLLVTMEPGARWAVYSVYRPSFTYYTSTFPSNIHSVEQLKAFLSSKEKVYCLFAETDYRGLESLVHKVAEFPNPKRDHPPYILVSNKQ